MRAMIFEAYGGPEKLALVGAPRPLPRAFHSHHPLDGLGAAWTRSTSGRTVGTIAIDVASEPA